MVKKTDWRRNTLFAVAGVLAGVLATYLVLSAAGWGPESVVTRQTGIHEMGSNVMPFGLSSTLHVFNMTETGGTMQVIERNSGSAEEIQMIQQHLQYEATLFSQGNFSDPMSLHGDQMPGLTVLAGGASQISIVFSPLPNGGQIQFTTANTTLITALHRWFGAQLSDHGSDAIPG